MVRTYWRLTASRAFRESLAALGLTSVGAIVLRILGGAIILSALALWGSSDATWDEWVARLAVAAFIVFLIPLFFAWKLVVVPAAQDDESQRTIAELRRKLEPNFGPERIDLVRFAEFARSEHGWNFGIDSLESLDFLDALRQAGTDGTLAFDGRFGAARFSEDLKSSFPLLAISKDHFSIAAMDVPRFFDGTNNYDIGTHDFELPPEKTYRDIHLHDEDAALKWLVNVAPKWRGERERVQIKEEERRKEEDAIWAKKDEAQKLQSPQGIEQETRP